jgi:hypothetical protein
MRRFTLGEGRKVEVLDSFVVVALLPIPAAHATHEVHNRPILTASCVSPFQQDSGLVTASKFWTSQADIRAFTPTTLPASVHAPVPSLVLPHLPRKLRHETGTWMRKYVSRGKHVGNPSTSKQAPLSGNKLKMTLSVALYRCRVSSLCIHQTARSSSICRLW